MRHRDFSRLTAEFSSALCKFNATCWPRWPGKKNGCSEAGHGDVSTQLIQIDLIVSLSWLVYSLCLLRSWCWPMALGQPISLQSDGRIVYTYELKHTLPDSCIFAANISPYHHMTIHTHNHALTYTHTYIYICTQTRTTWTQHMYIITTSHTKTSLDAS